VPETDRPWLHNQAILADPLCQGLAAALLQGPLQTVAGLAQTRRQALSSRRIPDMSGLFRKCHNRTEGIALDRLEQTLSNRQILQVNSDFLI
jgi:hypothetical protein